MAKRRNRPIAPATVNRSVVEPLRKLFIRARVVWRYSFQREPLWRNHRLKEPTERVRELHASDSAALDGALRPDFELWFRFARGLRDADINSRIILFASISGSAPSLSRARIGSDAKLIRVNLLVDCDAPASPMISSAETPNNPHARRMKSSFKARSLRSFWCRRFSIGRELSRPSSKVILALMRAAEALLPISTFIVGSPHLTQGQWTALRWQ
jgi:hypothetical protein